MSTWMFVCTRRNSLTDSHSFLQVLSVNLGMSILIPRSAIHRAKVEQMQRFRMSLVYRSDEVVQDETKLGLVPG